MWGARMKRILDRKGGRGLLGILMSLKMTLKLKKRVLITYRGGRWLHRWPDVTIPDPVLGGGPPFADFTAEAQDIYIHGYRPTAGDVVFDLGAGLGETTLLLSRMVGITGTVVAIEAHPPTFERLLDLIAVNHLTNVMPMNFAVSDQDGTTAISDTDDYVLNSIVDAEDGISIPTRTLDAIAEDLSIDRIDLLKMNIEGAERPALLGMPRMLAKTRNVCIGCHDFLADQGAPETLRTRSFCSHLLAAAGFKLSSRDIGPPWVRDYLYGHR